MQAPKVDSTPGKRSLTRKTGLARDPKEDAIGVNGRCGAATTWGPAVHRVEETRPREGLRL